MNAERRDLDALLESIANHGDMDWDEAARNASTDAERMRIEALRGIARIAAFSREQQSEAEGDTALPFERWGDLVLLERLGVGAHADVFRAWDATLQRDVALKLLRGEFAAGDATSPLLDEGRALARIRHPNVVTVYGIGHHDARVGLWMELVRGFPLDRWVEQHGALEPADAARLGREIGSALAAVHGAGLLHRDIKPANVIRAEDGRFVLTDFGLGIRGASSGSASRRSGTPMYMAPECLGGGPVTERSEVYALGLLVWYALAGRHPFEARTLDELRQRAMSGPPTPIETVRPGVPAALAAVVARAVATDPAARFAAAGALVRELESASPPAVVPIAPAGSTLARHAPKIALAAVVIGVLAVALLLLPRSVTRAPSPSPGAPPPASDVYDVEAALMRHGDKGPLRLAAGDRVRPGDQLSLQFHSTRAAWVYVLNEDDAGERYLLFPQPLFDARNPLPRDSTLALPGTVGGRPNAWTVTSRGGRERFLIVASLEPVAALEEELARLPAPDPERPIRYAPVRATAVERLRGAGGLTPLTPERAGPAPASPAFDRFRALADREAGVRGVWVREIVLENP